LEEAHNQPFVDDAAKYAKAKGGSLEEQVNLGVLKTMVSLATAAKPHLSGRVHTQLDARLAYSTEAMVAQALQLVELYKEAGLDKSQTAFKIPTTFQGVQACRILEKEHGVCCNMTVLFCLQQAVASAEAGASYVSPYLNLLGRADGDPATGIANAQQIRVYYDEHGIKTKVLGASFRTAEHAELMSQVADAVTINAGMLEELNKKKPAKLPELPKIQGKKEKDIERDPRICKEINMPC
jgi:transaldolase